MEDRRNFLKLMAGGTMATSLIAILPTEASAKVQELPKGRLTVITEKEVRLYDQSGVLRMRMGVL